MSQPWRVSHRFDVRALPLADAHYNRQKVGTPQFVPPSTCIVLLTEDADAVWTTTWPRAEYTKHRWAGAWVNSLFRNESPLLSSWLITKAVAASRAKWPDVPALGIVSFVDADKVRHKRDPGRCYRKAGWRQVGHTEGGLLCFQQLPDEMPAPDPAGDTQLSLAVSA